MNHDLEVLGIRHHGPGSARAVAGALDELAPDLVVIEGPPELDALLPLAGSPDLVPPVAGLIYDVATPRRSAFYPFAAFSPEWVAMRWALDRGVPVRFADLPAVHMLADGHDEQDAPSHDVIGLLATAAGYDDAEHWWEDVVEHRHQSSLERFASLRQAIAEARATAPENLENDRREAAMRRVLREAVKQGTVAMVCGAFHAPALVREAWPSAASDAKLLAGLPRTKVRATWAPWTADRLALRSGYGAGVTSPGWYAHLFTTWSDGRPEDVVPGWLTLVARALRAEGLDAPPASVVEAVRLAETLSTIRARPSAGLPEVNDATRAVLCEGSDLPLRLIERTLVVGEQLGTVPEGTPLVPLAQDLERLQRRLRLKPGPAPTTVTLDLRSETGLQKSLLLHRLTILDVTWGEEADIGRTTGTFKEGWTLQWRPELAVSLIEAGLFGTTVEGAASAKVAQLAREATDLATLGGLVDQALVADLPDALAATLDALAVQTAHQHDTIALLRAVEPLARTQRYGDVRRQDTSRVRDVLCTLVLRAAVGLRAACVSLDDEAALDLRTALDAAHRGVVLVDVETARWQEALRAVAADDRVHGLIAGRVNRLLLDGGLLPGDEVANRLSRSLSRASAGPAAAAWLDGFLEGEAVLLLHDPALLGIVDEWLGRIDETTFEDVLPLVRRTFGRFQAAERRQLGERVRHGVTVPSSTTSTLDLGRALPAVRHLAVLLGLEVVDDRA